MINKEELKVGDIVCSYDSYASNVSRRNIYENKVFKIGNKWITVGSKNGVKYDKERLYAELGGRALFLGDYKECVAYMEELDKRCDIIQRIGHRWNKLTSDELEDIERKINER